MTLIAGIDPGASGAVAVYDTDTRQVVYVVDMPVWYQTVNKKQRKRVDAVALQSMFEELVMYNVQLVVMEAVGGRPQQSATAGFVFGYTTGMIYMACIINKLPIETVNPQKWKKILNIPGKKEANDDDILNRAAEIFPHQRDMFRDYTLSSRGKNRVDRAEAAMLAKFGGDHVWRIHDPNAITDIERALAYKNAETGA